MSNFDRLMIGGFLTVILIFCKETYWRVDKLEQPEPAKIICSVCKSGIDTTQERSLMKYLSDYPFRHTVDSLYKVKEKQFNR